MQLIFKNHKAERECLPLKSARFRRMPDKRRNFMIYRYTKTGDAHAFRGTENQDALSGSDGENFAVLALADGISACPQAASGARTAANAAADLLEKRGWCFLDYMPENIAGIILSYSMQKLNETASVLAAPVREFASTLACIYLDKAQKKVVYFNLGDSMIITAHGSGCRVLAPPYRGEGSCCSTTTKNVLRTVKSGVADIAGTESVIIFSDGAWKEIYNRNTLRPEIFKLLTGNDFNRLESYLADREPADDCSFIAYIPDVPAYRREARNPAADSAA